MLISTIAGKIAEVEVNRIDRHFLLLCKTAYHLTRAAAGSRHPAFAHIKTCFQARLNMADPHELGTHHDTTIKD